MNRVVARIVGGLGNQLFCYAAARRLALVNGAELIIDDVTGFARDSEYRRQYGLDRFRIPARKATPQERLQPFERYRRGMMKLLSRRKSFEERRYVEQQGAEFDERLLGLKVNGTVYLDGLWQSEGYFKDVEHQIRRDLEITPPTDLANQRMSEKIRAANAVALHVRWFDDPNAASMHNLPVGYYRRAIRIIERAVASPHYFLFSDNPEASMDRLDVPRDRMTPICHNRTPESAYADLWLMSQCRHFITANSTFSWWAAWLGAGDGKLVVAPDFRVDGKAAWGFQGLIPEEWILAPVA
jgi:hypothetical protein